ncbi:helix-turn-helix transcriptional regulator [Streptosporangium longisporum]|uniref:HTH cro/C1-type domain-containing protein n=1 Tax=Streptosporangium longisporum TaxID=46187 RepID=A0ABP6KDW8_9ACTN
MTSPPLAERLNRLFAATPNPETGRPYKLREAARMITAGKAADGTDFPPTPIVVGYLSQLTSGQRSGLSLDKALGIAWFFGIDVQELATARHPGRTAAPDTRLTSEPTHPYPASSVFLAHRPAEQVGPNRLGARLRSMRDEHGLTAAEAADAIGVDESVVTGIEDGTAELQPTDLEELLLLYGVNDPYQRELLAAVARGEHDDAWWYDDVSRLPLWLLVNLAVEDGAELLRSYNNDTVPALLQTERYARASRLAVHHPDPAPEQIDLAWRILRRRQERVLDGTLRIWAVVQEHALLDPIGGPDVLLEQLAHLAEAAERPHVALQVNLTRDGRYRPRGGAFSLFGVGQGADAVYVPQLVTDNMITDPLQVAEYRMAHTRLSLSAEPAARTPKVLAEFRRRILDGTR